MPPQPQIPVTQRAYTLRLRGLKKDDTAWKDALWATHEAVNRGAKAFGDWLLTMRGGLCHTLVDVKISAKGKKQERDPSEEEKRCRRVLLALSWLSVEDEHGAPAGNGVRVATGRDTAAIRGEAVKKALGDILEKRGIKGPEIEVWLRDCGPSLEARIREDAVWVDRSRTFDEVCSRWSSVTREDAHAVLACFFGDTNEYLSLPVPANDEDRDLPVAASGDQDVEFRNIARGWISFNFGTGQKSDNTNIAIRLATLAGMKLERFDGKKGSDLAEAIAEKVNAAAADKVDETLDSIRAAVGWKTGRPSKGRLAIETACRKARLTRADLEALTTKLGEEAENKKKSAGRRVCSWVKDFQQDLETAIGFKYVTGRDLIGEYSTMLDHAARRVAIAHSWIKRAEQRRREFEEDAKGLCALQERVLLAVKWLDQFCAERSATSGAIAEGGYRIRKRAVEGWARVVKAWARPSSKTEDDRISAARELQADPEIDKFGDIQLFEALAVDDAVCVWRNGTEPDPSILIDYAAGTTAKHDQRRFKVPAYRHPDALRHPVFCDFGNSRWTITFACHKAAMVRNGEKHLAKDDAEWIKEHHGLRMGLWDGNTVDDVSLRWSSKRLTSNLALDGAGDTNASDVTRADRLGRAASGAFGHAAIMNVFAEADWNGRLQAPRAQLDRIARLEDDGKRKQARALQRRLPWLVSFSPRLRPSGPFIKYAASQDIAPNRKGEYYPNAPANKGRARLAKLILARLPGLRVLSVDLGHRFAAACAVWETIPHAAFKKDIAGLKVLGGGSGGSDLYLHVEKSGEDGKPRTVIYRRIGPDTQDGTSHPAPWARLDRQFLIKLQGEEEPPRRSAPQEADMVRDWKMKLDRVRDGMHDPLPHRIDLLMSDAVATLRRALRRHGDRARIAFNLTTTEKPTAGGGRQHLDRAGRVELLMQTLTLWHGLFSGEQWEDPWAADKWRKHGLPEITIPGAAEDVLGAARRPRRGALDTVLRPHVEHLADQDLSEWSAAWTTRWRQDEKIWSGRDGILRAMKRWIAPRGLRPLPTDDNDTCERKKVARAGVRYVGGLSIIRINTISGLYQLLKAFKMRPEPGDLRKNIPEKGDDDLADFNRRLLDMRDRLREQRVKQLASRIIEAALGIGRITIQNGCKMPARPRVAVDSPCHAVVIESLTYYRPDDLRTRRENRQLMQWSSAKIQKYLKEGCHLNGLHLREVPANYTSRQCSRTGLPGIRCDDVPAGEFLVAPWWNKAVAAARKKLEKNGAGAKDRFFVDLADRLKKLRSENKPLPATVRVPRQGGNLFVAASLSDALRSNGQVGQSSTDRRAVQADLNAAANIGLRALLDPDWPGRWWYVPCKAGTSEPAFDRGKGSAVFGAVKRLSTEGAAPGERLGQGMERGKAQKEIENLWRDPAPDVLATGQWKPTRTYWHDVETRVVELLRRRAGL